MRKQLRAILLGTTFVVLLSTLSAVPTEAAPPSITCADLETQEFWLRSYLSGLLNCDVQTPATITPSPTPTRTTAPLVVRTATPSLLTTFGPTRTVTTLPRPTVAATRPKATVTPPVTKVMSQLVQDQIVTALYASADGTLYYGVAQKPEYLAETLHGGYALWKKSPGSDAVQLTPWTMNVIGGVTLRGGVIYFNEAGALRRMPDDGSQQEGEVVIRFTNLSQIYAHVNHSLTQAVVNGKEALLIGVGSVRDSAFPGQGMGQDIQLPYYEDFPTGRILYATFDWLDQAHGYEATRGVAGQFDEMARGVRNPWGMTSGMVNGAFHILAADNDPAFTPEKNDANLSDAGDELNDIQIATSYGHPYAYAGQEPAIGAKPPIVVFPDGSVPSGVAIAGGKVFVSFQNTGMIVKVDIAKRTWTPVITDVQPYTIFGVGNLLYIADFGGIRVIDARSL